DFRARVLGMDLSFPVILAPVGYIRLMHPGGEIVSARAAGAAGIAFTQSTISGHKLESVKAASSGPVCYQLYLVGGREAAEDSLARSRRDSPRSSSRLILLPRVFANATCAEA